MFNFFGRKSDSEKELIMMSELIWNQQNNRRSINHFKDFNIYQNKDSVKSDFQINQEVLNELGWNYSVSKNVTAQTEDGFVILSGEVEWEYQKTSAENSVSHIIGVKEIINHIIVKPKTAFLDF